MHLRIKDMKENSMELEGMSTPEKDSEESH